MLPLAERLRQLRVGKMYVEKGGDLQHWLRSKDFDPVDRAFIEARIKERLEPLQDLESTRGSAT